MACLVRGQTDCDSPNQAKLHSSLKFWHFVQFEQKSCTEIALTGKNMQDWKKVQHLIESEVKKSSVSIK